MRRNDVIAFGNVKLRYESEHAPDVKPLPQPTAALSFEGSKSKGRPAGFANPYGTSQVDSSKPAKVEEEEIEEEEPEEEEEEPTPVKAQAAPSPAPQLPWTMILTGAGVLAAAGVIFFFSRIFS